MKTMCPLDYHPNGFVATHALGHMMYIYIYRYSTQGLSIISMLLLLPLQPRIPNTSMCGLAIPLLPLCRFF